MTEKYFTVDNHCNLYDNEHNVFYPIEDSRENIELLCRRLNNLINKNNRLEQKIDEVKEAINYLHNQELVTLADINGTVSKIDKIVNNKYKW